MGVGDNRTADCFRVFAGVGQVIADKLPPGEVCYLRRPGIHEMGEIRKGLDTVMNAGKIVEISDSHLSSLDAYLRP